MIEPLRLSVDLDCPIEHAFDVYTRRLSVWWPKGHSTSGNLDTRVELEPREGGRIFERTPDGTEFEWGRIVRWEPPSRLVYDWHIGRDADGATQVELTFIDLGDDQSRLDIVHRGWERLGAEGESWRNANSAGWASLIPAYRAATE